LGAGFWKKELKVKKWDVSHNLNSNENFIEKILEIRGVKSASDQEAFLNPPSVDSMLEDLPSEFKKSLEEAKRIVRKAIKKNLPIVIHGDYDADGICATAILFRVIKNELNYKNCFSFIPNRFEHGYGLSESSIEAVAERLKNEIGDFYRALFITVDSGITAVKEIEYAKSLGFEVIVTDHHQKPKIMPKADCIVENAEIVGSAISWMFGKVLGSKDLQSISLAAVASVTDLQPLFGFNRSIVKEGLEVLNKNPPLGIKKLVEAAGTANKEIDAYTLGWVIGPRINATGRISDADLALMLLIVDDERKVQEFAEELNELNNRRQGKTEEMYDLAGELMSEKLPKVIVSKHLDYHEGIIGLVAAKLVQRYYRPSIVLSIGEFYCKGSVRSVPGVDIIEFLREFEDIFVSLGGHPMAAGFTIEREKIGLLEEKIESVQNLIKDEYLVPALKIDLKIPLSLVDLDFVSEVGKLKPFGIGNMEPVFMSEKVGITGVNVVGARQNHISLNLFCDGKRYRAIYFGGAEYFTGMKVGDSADIAYSVRRDRYNSKDYVNIVVKDLRLSK